MGKTVATRRKKPGPQPLGKITVTIRMFPRTKRALDKAARASKKQISEYLEELVLSHLRTGGFLAEPSAKTSIADKVRPKGFNQEADSSNN
jgi:hypothetical protein